MTNLNATAQKFSPQSSRSWRWPTARRRKATLGQSALFGGAEPEALRLTNYDNWSAEERLRREFEAIGFFISGHPLDAYQNVMSRLRVEVWARFAAQ